MTIVASKFYMRKAHALATNGATSDFFAVDLAAFSENASDPSGGANLVLTCECYANVYDATSNTQDYYLMWFRLFRKGGVYGYSIDQALGAAAGVSFTGAVSGTTCKIQITASVAHTQECTGLVKFEAHYQ